MTLVLLTMMICRTIISKLQTVVTWVLDEPKQIIDIICSFSRPAETDPYICNCLYIYMRNMCVIYVYDDREHKITNLILMT